MGLEEFGGRGRRSFGGIEGILGGRRSFLGGGVEGFLGGRRSVGGVGGVLGESKEFWGCRRSFGGGHRSLGGWSVEFRRVGGGVGGSHGSQGKRREDQSSLTE